jgi:hypothetical protein
MREILASCLSGRFTEPLTPAEWECFIKVASEERVLPQLAHRLPEAPPEILDFLADVQKLNRQRNERILDEASAIAQLSNGIDVQPVFLKGCAFLLEGLYPDPGSRYLCDLDVLIPGAQLSAVVQALELRGYRAVTGDRMAHLRHHYPPLQRPGTEDGFGYPPVELHHSLAIGRAGRLLSGDEVLRDSRLVEWRGARVRIPSPPHLVTHLVLHSQIHHSYSERIWPPLRALCDMAMLMQHYGEQLEWAAVNERFRAYGEKHTLLLHLLQVEETLGVSAPFAIRLGLIGLARWKRRQALNHWPNLRFADPVYLVLSTLSRRFRLLRSAMGAPRGWQLIARMLMRPDFYRRMLAEVSLR